MSGLLSAPIRLQDAQNRTQSYSHHNTSDTYVTNAGGQRAQKSVTKSGSTTTGTYDAELMGLGIYNQTAPVSQTVYYERDPSGRLLVLASTSQAVVTLRGVACPSTTTCYAVGDAGSIISTTNGITWTPEGSGTSTTLYGIACPGATTCFAVGDNGTILSTTDGHTWSSQTVGSATLDGITCYTTTQCWVVGSGGTFLHTSDGGQTWVSENVGGTTKLMLAITCPFGSTCYAVGALGAIWVSNTAGASWSNLSLSTLQWFTGIACPPPGDLSCYVTGTTGPIRYTNNGFSSGSVSSQTNPSGFTLRGIACTAASTCLAVGSGGAMVETTSSGGTWTSVSSGTAYDLKAVACPSSSTCYVVGAGSTILQTTSAGSTWSWTPQYMQATPYYYGLDGHGSVVNVTDQSGTIQNQYRYDPYGNSLARTENATIANPWQYAGGFYEAESGLYLLGMRYYDPSLGLFLQVDPAGLSEYSYAGDNPCNNSDPTGMITCYQYVTPSAVSGSVHRLEGEGSGAVGTDTGGTVGGVIGLGIGLLLGLGTFGAGTTAIVGTGVGAYLGGLGDSYGDGQREQEINAYYPYMKTGFNVQYTDNGFLGTGIGASCNDGDSQHPRNGAPIVSGYPYNQWLDGDQP